MLRTVKSVRDRVGGILACLLCIGLLMSLATLDSGGAKAIKPPVAAAAAASATVSSLGRKHLDPFISSKRRVPNGPDPIHNRCHICGGSFHEDGREVGTAARQSVVAHRREVGEKLRGHLEASSDCEVRYMEKCGVLS